jgi:putative NIF3 family GTP cyclohydrolase 1 type 2
VTAAEIVDRIRRRLADAGIAWRAQTVDTFKAGDPDTPVRGIATTGMATLDVLRRAAARGRNLVVTHEPTFYGHLDETAPLAGDAVYEAKRRFVADNGLVVWRFHDHAHAMRPDPLVAGSARALGLAPYASPESPRLFVVPPTTLRALAADFARRVGGHAIRVAGDPAMRVTRIGLGIGYSAGYSPPLGPDLDVSIGGEQPESGGNAEYALDAAALGRPKGFVVLGHMLSEDHGMREVAEWLRGFVTDVPVDFVPAGEPFARA